MDRLEGFCDTPAKIFSWQRYRAAATCFRTIRAGNRGRTTRPGLETPTVIRLSPIPAPITVARALLLEQRLFGSKNLARRRHIPPETGMASNRPRPGYEDDCEAAISFVSHFEWRKGSRSADSWRPCAVRRTTGYLSLRGSYPSARRATVGECGRSCPCPAPHVAAWRYPDATGNDSSAATHGRDLKQARFGPTVGEGLHLRPISCDGWSKQFRGTPGTLLLAATIREAGAIRPRWCESWLAR